MPDTAPPSAGRYLVVGCGLGLLGELDKVLPAGSVTVVDETDLLDAGDLRAKAMAHPCVAEVVDGPAQRHDGLLPLPADALAGTVAVIPSWEYTVVTAAACAETAGVPGAGLKAARTLRDKVRLREAGAAAGLPQPRFAEVTGVADIRAFAAAHDGDLVLKPADRQAGVGVRLLAPGDDPAAAWERTRAADDAKLRSAGFTPGRFLVEERLHGPEISAELLVADGEVRWLNVTDKSVWPGPFPVEAGHTLPSPRPAALWDRVAEANRALVEAVGFRTGVLHSEWILADGTDPHLVECAGRLPGDAIVPLIDLAYGGSLVEDFVRVLRGEHPDRPVRAPRAAAVRFVSAAPGRVRAVRGADEAAAADAVFAAAATVSEGALVGELTSSWDRVGHVLTVAADAPSAEAAALAAASLITVETEPVTE